MTLDEQVAFIQRHKEKLYARTLRAFKDHKAEIIAMMPDGIVAGYEEHGESSWTQSHEALTRGQLEELRDACNYQGFKAYQGWPR